MATIRIPESARPGWESFVALDEPLAESLRSAFDSQAPTLDIDALVNAVSTRVPEIDRPTLRAVVETLMGLCVARTSRDMDLPTFVKSVLGSPNLGVSKEQTAIVGPRLEAFLACDSIATTAKAIDLQFENRTILLGSRILSDVRPVFRDLIRDSPVATVVIQTLKLTVQEDGEVKQLFIALDSEDISRLQKTLARAREKGDALRRLIPKLPVLEAGPEDE